MEQHFNSLYREYEDGLIDRSELEGAIYQYFVKNQFKTNLANWTQDEYEDFVSWFYPRLHNAIDSFKKKGGTFETFINRVWNISAKEYRIRITINSVTEYSAWSVHVPDLYAYEESPVYSYDKKENVISEFIFDKKGRKNPKQLLALILKCYYYVSDDLLERIAPKLDIDSKKLKEMIEKLRTIRQIKDDEIYLMKERIYCQYYRCIVYEKRLAFLQENSPAWTNLKIRLEKARTRLEKMRGRLTQVRTDASNRQVASVIGTSKGAVDASLHRLKAKWDILSDKSLLN